MAALLGLAAIVGMESGPSMAWAQDELFVTNCDSNSVLVFARTASGNTAPLRTLQGAVTGLSCPHGLAVDQINNELQVQNALSKSITVYPRTASGNTAPLRTLQGPATGLNFADHLFVDPVNNELLVTALGPSVVVFARTASGNTAPLRTLQGPATGLQAPQAVAVDPVNNELIVGNAGNSITIYPRTASGNTPPLRNLKGPATGLNGINNLLWDGVNNELIVANQFSSLGTPSLRPSSITVYPRTADGDAPPLRTLTGPELVGPLGLAVDTINNELFVVKVDRTCIVTGNVTTAVPCPLAVLVYLRTANGNTSPLRILSGAATGFTSPQYLAVTTSGPAALASAVLPGSRSVQVGTAATAFATILNAGPGIAFGCTLAPLTALPATFSFQTTSSTTNQVTGSPNAPVNIAVGAAQSFVFAFTPSGPIPPTEVQLSFDCVNSDPAPITPGLNTLLLSASTSPIPDIVALAATLANDGIVNIPGATGTGVFAVATVNVGAGGSLTASVDTGSASLPVNVSICQTNPGTGVCQEAPAGSVTTAINAGATPTFGVFVGGNGPVSFAPATNRIFVRFRDGGGVVRGATSVAVRTQ